MFSRKFRVIEEEHEVDCLWNLTTLDDRIASPVESMLQSDQYE